jgi:hypothetical protein
MRVKDIIDNLAIHSRLIIDSGHDLRPIIHAVDHEGQNIVIDVQELFDEDVSSDIRADQLRNVLRSVDAAMYAIAVEAWTTKISGISPSESPDRRSTLLIVGEGGGESLSVVYEIFENPPHRKVSDDPVIIKNFAGKLSSLLNTNPRTIH